MAVSSHERAEGQVVVDVFVAIEVAELAAAGLFYKDGPGIVIAIVAGYAERNAFEVFLMRFGGLGRAALESRELFLQIGVHHFSGINSGQRFLLRLRAIRMPERRAVPGRSSTLLLVDA